MDNDVKIWSDFLKVRFHPRTITSIDEYKHNDSSNAFHNFAQGLALWDSYKMKEVWTDNLRLYAEECDYLQVSMYRICNIILRKPQMYKIIKSKKNKI